MLQVLDRCTTCLEKVNKTLLIRVQKQFFCIMIILYALSEIIKLNQQNTVSAVGFDKKITLFAVSCHAYITYTARA